MVYVIEGEGAYRDAKVSDRRFHAGCIFQRFPGRIHAVTYDSPGVVAYVAVPAEVLDLLRLTHALLDDEPVFEIGIVPDLARRVPALVKELASAPERELSGCLVRMQEWIAAVHRRRAVLDAHTDAMDRARELLGHGAGPQVVAAEIGEGYHSFRKRFTRAEGISPNAYRIRRRVERAMSLLADPDRTLSSIADELGFSDAFALSAQFKRVVGVAPSAFRKQN